MEKLDSFVRRLPDPSVNIDIGDAIELEDSDAVVARLAADFLREALKQEVETLAKVRIVKKRLKRYEEEFSGKDVSIKKMRSELQSYRRKVNCEMDKMAEKLREMEVEIDKKRDELNQIMSEFQKCNVSAMPGEFAAGGIDKVRKYIQDKHAAGITVEALLFSGDNITQNLRDISKAHVDGIPVEYSSAVKKDMFIAFMPDQRTLRRNGWELYREPQSTMR